MVRPTDEIDSCNGPGLFGLILLAAAGCGAVHERLMIQEARTDVCQSVRAARSFPTHRSPKLQLLNHLAVFAPNGRDSADGGPSACDESDALKGDNDGFYGCRLGWFPRGTKRPRADKPGGHCACHIGQADESNRKTTAVPKCFECLN
jgi:hypothetical protein